MENGLYDRLVQVGIRTLNLHQEQQIKKFNVESIEMKHWPLGQPLVFDSRSIIQQVNMPLVGADLVEFNPNKDIDNMTSQLAAKLVKEIAEKMLLSI